jgi:prophage antirepressor-like protein
MDIVTAFQLESNLPSLQVNIQGTTDDPLFQANQIGALLGLSNIHDSTHDFDDEEKVLARAETPGGLQTVTFLTEQGLYRLLGMSRKPIARPFQKWVARVIKEIRKKGKYEAEVKLAEKDKAIAEMGAEIKIVQESKRSKVIYIFDTRNYGRQDDVHTQLKIGATSSLVLRTQQYKTLSPNGRTVYTETVPDNMHMKTVENFVHMMLARYRVGHELYVVPLAVAKAIVMDVANVIRMTTIPEMSVMELKWIQKTEIVTPLVRGDDVSGRLGVRNATTQTEDEGSETLRCPEGLPPTDTADHHTAKFERFLAECCDIGPTLRVPGKDIEGQYRIWSGVKPEQEVYRKLLDFLKTRFRSVRIPGAASSSGRVTNGFQGVRLKPVEYVKSFPAGDVETFLFQEYEFCPSGKATVKELTADYEAWRASVGKNALANAGYEVREFLKTCPYVIDAMVHISSGGQGYYGVRKRGAYVPTLTSSTAKAVEKRDAATHDVIGRWTTIAKAAEAENMCPAKMSRTLKAGPDAMPKDSTHYYVIA